MGVPVAGVPGRGDVGLLFLLEFIGLDCGGAASLSMLKAR